MPLPSHPRTVLLAVLLAALAIVVAHSRAAGGPPAALTLLSAFACFGYASIAAHYLVRARGLVPRVRVGAPVAIACAVAMSRNGIHGGELRWSAIEALIATGVIGAAAYTLDIARASDRTVRRARISSFRDALIVPAAVASVPFFLWINASINPVYDLRVYGFEQVLGVPVTETAMRWYAAAGPAGTAAAACYLAIPIGLSLVAAAQSASSASTRVLVGSIVAAVAGFALYAVCPVVGPVHTFSGAPPAGGLSRAALVPMTVASHVPRNGMPSLHTVWALIIAASATRLARGWRIGLTMFAACNICAALGRYEHWFPDLVAAVPFAAAIELAIISPRQGRTRWVLPGVFAALTVAWVGALRQGWLLDTGPLIAWILVASTVLTSVYVVFTISSSCRSDRRHPAIRPRGRHRGTERR